MERARKGRANILIGLLTTVLVAVLMFLRIPALETLEEKLYDYRYKTRGAMKCPDNIVIAAIDERSIEKLGRWPWSRDKLAMLVEKLNESDAEIIMLDLILSEAEKNDPLLANAIKEAGNVILPVAFDLNSESTQSVQPKDEFLLRSSFHSVINPEMFNKYQPISAKSVLMPIAPLSQEAMAFGHMNIFPDNDGTLRWESLVIEHNGFLYPSLDLQTACAYLGIPPEKVVLKATEGIQLGRNRYLATDKWGRAPIYYYGPVDTFPHISISDVLDGKVKGEFLRGKIIIIGATAVGIYDLRVTPFSPVMPGVEKHANMIASILENRSLRCASLPANLIVLLLSGILFSMIIVRFKAVGASGITALYLLLIFFSAFYLFVHRDLWVNITYPSINALFILISVMGYNYTVEERYARKIRAMFSSYVTERVVNELIKNPDLARLGGERREVTVLFSDIRGFTTFSEKHSPEDVVAMLNEYLGAMTDVIFRWEGTLDKFVGDEIVAFWGAPMQQENHAELAVKCALHMANRLRELQQKWSAEGKATLHAGIGINTGEVLVGNIGAEGKKMDYTVIGDHVNLGARVEALTRKYDAHILITEFTLNKIRGLMAPGKPLQTEEAALGHTEVTGLERVAVKGKELPVEIYELKSLDHGAASVIKEK